MIVLSFVTRLVRWLKGTDRFKCPECGGEVYPIVYHAVDDDGISKPFMFEACGDCGHQTKESEKVVE